MGHKSFVLIFLAMGLVAACGDDPADPAPTADAGVCVATGTIAFLETCNSNADCTSCVCKTFGHESVCSQACTAPTDCPAPSGGCSSGGFCMP